MSEKPIISEWGRYANLITDPGVLFCAGNATLEALSGGGVGLAFNVVATAVCLVLRAHAENLTAKDFSDGRPPILGTIIPISEKTRERIDTFKKNAGDFIRPIANSPRTSLAFAGAAQFGVAAAALCTGGLTLAVAIPFIFGTADVFAALKEGPIEKIRDGVSKSVIGKTVGTFVNNLKYSRQIKAAGSVAWKVLTTSELYFTTGLMLAGGSVFAGALFAGAGVWSIARVFTKSKPKTALGRHGPLFTLAAGSTTATLVNAFSHHPQVATAMGLFAVAYGSIAALLEYGGPAQAASKDRNEFRRLKLADAPAPA